MSKADVHKLLESKPFAVETISVLEKYVAGEDYDFEADHALLKLYQFHPSKVNKAIIAQILARALSKVPTCDFTQHLYLIPESIVRQSCYRTNSSHDFSLSIALFPLDSRRTVDKLHKETYFLTYANTNPQYDLKRNTFSFQQTSDESIVSSIAAHDLLERAMFVEFWARATGALFESASFKKSVRSCASAFSLFDSPTFEIFC
jgi:hypothetical protein